jgi:hypothetical protein
MLITAAVEVIFNEKQKILLDLINLFEDLNHFITKRFCIYNYPVLFNPL